MDELLKKLYEHALITKDKCCVVAIESELSGKPTHEILQSFGFLGADVIAEHIGESATSTINIDNFVPDPSALSLLPEKLARQHRALPVLFDEKQQVLVVAVADVLSVLDGDRIQRAVGEDIQVSYRMAYASDVLHALDKSYGVSHTLDEIITEIAADHIPELMSSPNAEQPFAGSTASNTDDESSRLIAEAGPIVRLVDALFQDAVTRQASDIHLSPEHKMVRVQYRIDGRLEHACYLHMCYWAAILIRLKVLSGIDISETRHAQDGQVTRTINGRKVDFRVASFPLVTGENLVLRVLDRRRAFHSIAGIAGNADASRALHRMINKPSGLVLVCGPTGSGKTTTLYAMLQSLDANTLNIMTLEDPVEYSIAGIRQTTIQPAVNLGFAEGVKGILRQDPDVLLVGEIRDKDSCAMTCRAAMTGHLVLSSLHAPDCLRAIARLQDLGAERSVLAASLSGVVAQRLVRKICRHCTGDNQDCAVCSGSGYYGREVLLECLPITAEFSALLQANATLQALEQQAIQSGFLPMAKIAASAISSGVTTRAEVNRVFGTELLETTANKAN